MRRLICLTVLLAACGPEVRVAPPPNDRFPLVLAGTKRSMLFDGRFQGDLTAIPIEWKQPIPAECVPKTFMVALYDDVLLAEISFASTQALDTCLLALPDRPMDGILRMIRATKFAWFTKRDVGVGLVGERVVGTFHRNGLDTNAKRLTDAWHYSLGILDQRHELDLDMLKGQ